MSKSERPEMFVIYLKDIKCYARFGSHSSATAVEHPEQATLYSRRSDAVSRKNKGDHSRFGGFWLTTSDRSNSRDDKYIGTIEIKEVKFSHKLKVAECTIN